MIIYTGSVIALGECLNSLSISNNRACNEITLPCKSSWIFLWMRSQCAQLCMDVLLAFYSFHAQRALLLNAQSILQYTQTISRRHSLRTLVAHEDKNRAICELGHSRIEKTILALRSFVYCNHMTRFFRSLLSSCQTLRANTCPARTVAFQAAIGALYQSSFTIVSY